MKTRIRNFADASFIKTTAVKMTAGRHFDIQSTIAVFKKALKQNIAIEIIQKLRTIWSFRNPLVIPNPDRELGINVLSIIVFQVSNGCSSVYWEWSLDHWSMVRYSTVHVLSGAVSQWHVHHPIRVVIVLSTILLLWGTTWYSSQSAVSSLDSYVCFLPSGNNTTYSTTFRMYEFNGPIAKLRNEEIYAMTKLRNDEITQWQNYAVKKLRNDRITQWQNYAMTKSALQWSLLVFQCCAVLNPFQMHWGFQNWNPIQQCLILIYERWESTGNPH